MNIYYAYKNWGVWLRVHTEKEDREDTLLHVLLQWESDGKGQRETLMLTQLKT